MNGPRPKAPPLVARGKVRDLYDLGDRLLMVATDRVSAFDVALPTPVPDKGRLLTALSLFWFDRLAHVVPNHVATTDLSGLGLDAVARARFEGRAFVARKARVLPVECVVRGRLAGGGWREYRATGAVSGVALPKGLAPFAELPEPVFTPSTKAGPGARDEAIPFARMAATIGAETAERVRDVALALFREGAAHAAARGLVLADAKFEMGFVDGELVLVDECLTSDSARYWRAGSLRPGAPPHGLDKQIVRDWLAALPGWDRSRPAPDLPPALVAETRARYVEAYERLTGRTFRP